MYLFKRERPVTTKPSDWPQGRFKKKACRCCSKEFEPQSPCHLYCSDECVVQGKTSKYLERTYGITLQDYLEILNTQNHRCKICREKGFKMKEHHNLLLVVDHCHKENFVRGLLCHNCNRGIGLLKDSVSNLSAAIDYLEGSTTRSKDRTLK
jgi:hypothetical protein